MATSHERPLPGGSRVWAFGLSSPRTVPLKVAPPSLSSDSGEEKFARCFARIRLFYSILRPCIPIDARLLSAGPSAGCRLRVRLSPNTPRLIWNLGAEGHSDLLRGNPAMLRDGRDISSFNLQHFGAFRNPRAFRHLSADGSMAVTPSGCDFEVRQLPPSEKSQYLDFLPQGARGCAPWEVLALLGDSQSVRSPGGDAFGGENRFWRSNRRKLRSGIAMRNALFSPWSMATYPSGGRPRSLGHHYGGPGWDVVPVSRRPHEWRFLFPSPRGEVPSPKT